MKQTDNKTNNHEKNRIRSSADTFGGYSYVLDYRSANEDESGSDERAGFYSVILAMIVVFTAGILCIAAVIFTDIFKTPESAGHGALLASPDTSSVTDAQLMYYTDEQLADNCSAFTVSIYATEDGRKRECGTGVVITSDGYIVTGCQIVGDFASVQAVLCDGTEYTARVIGQDCVREISVIKIDAEGLTTASFAANSEIKQGDRVVAMRCNSSSDAKQNAKSGSIFSDEFLFTKFGGTQNEKQFNVIRTDIIPTADMCGAPLVNSEGKIVGMIFDCGNQGYGGYAIPSGSILSVIGNIIGAYSVESEVDGSKTVCGITGKDITSSVSARYNLPLGVLVAGIECDCPAAFAGVEKGDIVISFNYTTVRNTEELEKELSLCDDGDIVTLRVYRKGSLLEFTFIL